MPEPSSDPAGHVRWFRDAAPYIHAHRGRTFVVAFSGDAVASDGFAYLIHDIALLRGLGLRLVLVHGARPQIEAQLERRGGRMRYERGLRVTDDAALQAVKEAAGYLRVEIEALLSVGVANTPMAGARIRVASGNFVTARPIGVRDGVDYGHTGEVRRIDTEAISGQLDEGMVVLLSPLGYSPTGEVFNLSAEEVATATAGALQADKLLLLSETLGIEDRSGYHATQLSPQEAEERLGEDRTLADETRLHLRSAVQACRQGVPRVHIVDRRTDGGLLLELYTRDGVGTLVTTEAYEDLHQARIEEVSGILELIAPLEAAGVLVRRSREQLELEIDRFTVLKRDGKVIATSALYPFPEEAVGEVACLAVHPDYRAQGRGDRLIKHTEERARQLGLSQIFVLTTRTAQWFQERGFRIGELATLPVARQDLYNYRRNSRILIKDLL